VPTVAHVLDVGRLEEGVDPGKMRLLAPGEGRDRPVGQALGPGQAHIEGPFHFPVPALAGELAFGVQRLPALGLELVVVRMVATNFLGRRPQAGMPRRPAEKVADHAILLAFVQAR
jgi:hypothetical protein